MKVSDWLNVEKSDSFVALLVKIDGYIESELVLRDDGSMVATRVNRNTVEQVALTERQREEFATVVSDFLKTVVGGAGPNHYEVQR